MPTSTPAATIGHNNPPALDVILKDRHQPLWDRLKKWQAKAKKADLNPQTLEDCAKLEDLFGEGRDLANDADGIREEEKKPFLENCRLVDSLFNGELRDVIGADKKKPGLAQQLLSAAATKRLAITREEQRKADEKAARLKAEADRLEEQRKRQEDAGKVRQADVTAAKVDGLDRQADQLTAQAAAPVAEASRARTASGRATGVSVKLTCTGVVRAELDLEALRPYFKQDALKDAVNAALKMDAFTTLKGASIIEEAVGRVR